MADASEDNAGVAHATPTRGITTLKAAARRLGVSGYSTYRKKDAEQLAQEILRAVRERMAARRIARWYARRRAEYVNDTDFYAMEDLPPRTFRARTSDGRKVYRFDPVNLARYMIQAGRFENPYDNTPFTDADLLRLDELLDKVAPGSFMKLSTRRDQLRIMRAREAEEKRTEEFLEEDAKTIIERVCEFDIAPVLDEIAERLPVEALEIPRPPPDTPDLQAYVNAQVPAARRRYATRILLQRLVAQYGDRLRNDLVTLATRSPPRARAVSYDLVHMLTEAMQKSDECDEKRALVGAYHNLLNTCLSMELEPIFEQHEEELEEDANLLARVMEQSRREAEGGAANAADDDDVIMVSDDDSDHEAPRPVRRAINDSHPLQFVSLRLSSISPSGSVPSSGPSSVPSSGPSPEASSQMNAAEAFVRLMGLQERANRNFADNLRSMGVRVVNDRQGNSSEQREDLALLQYLQSMGVRVVNNRESLDNHALDELD